MSPTPYEGFSFTIAVYVVQAGLVFIIERQSNSVTRIVSRFWAYSAIFWETILPFTEAESNPSSGSTRDKYSFLLKLHHNPTYDLV